MVSDLRLEDPERCLREVLGELDQLAAETQVRPVDAIAVHRLGIGHARDRQRHLVAGNLRPQSNDQLLDQRLNVLGLAEAELDVQLAELGLAIGAEVFVAEASRDLEVALDTGHHQQLLEQLRRLRQRVPRTWLQPDGDQEVAGALRCRLRQVRRLDVEEVVLGHDLADDPA